MIDTNNMTNLEKWTYNFLLQSHFRIYGKYPKGEKPIPNIKVRKSDYKTEACKPI